MSTSLTPQVMAEIVANDCLRHARECAASYPTSKGFMSFLVGKSDAAAFIYPNEVTLAAENEIRFLERYYKRHNLYWTLS